MHGIPVIGLCSITHMKDKEKDTLHPDVLEIMLKCQVKRMVWLTDGDALEITSKELKDGVDLYKRPKNFFSSCEVFKHLLDDYKDVEEWFLHIDPDNILQTVAPPTLCKLDNKEPLTLDQIKGLDDLLITFKDRTQEI